MSLPHGRTLTVLSQCVDLTGPTSPGLPDRGASSSRNLHKTLRTASDTFDQSQPLLHALHRSFFAFPLCFYLSRNNKDENVAYFLPFLVLKWLHKNSPILILFFFKAHWLIGQLSQYNLTKLFLF